MVQDLMVAVEAVRDAFYRAVFADQDLAAAVALAAPDFSLVNLPAGTGVPSADRLPGYLRDDVFGHLPADLTFRRIARVVDRWRVAEEAVASFTHDRELPWLLPGVPATGCRAEVLVTSMVTVNRTQITSCRSLWDHATLCAQLGLGVPSSR